MLLLLDRFLSGGTFCALGAAQFLLEIFAIGESRDRVQLSLVAAPERAFIKSLC